MFRLPVSGLPVIVSEPTGAEDLFLRETRTENAAVALGLIGRLVRKADGEPIEWLDCSVPDLEVALLLLRQETLGDLIATDARCPSSECGARVDVSFRIGELLQSKKSSRSKNTGATAQGEWILLAHKGREIEFRLPTGADLLAIDGDNKQWLALEERCIRPARLERAAIRRAERAMEALAPRFSSNLAGDCPECGRHFEYYFDVFVFVLRELRNHAAGVLQDVHLIARHYKWGEREILTLPRSRRLAYVEMLSGGEVAGMKRRSPYLRSIAGSHTRRGLTPLLSPARVRVWPLRTPAVEPSGPAAPQMFMPHKATPLLTPRIREGAVPTPASSTPVTPSSLTDASPLRTALQTDNAAQTQTPAIEPSTWIGRTAATPRTTQVSTQVVTQPAIQAAISASSPAERETPVQLSPKNRMPPAEILEDRQRPPVATNQIQTRQIPSAPDPAREVAVVRLRPETEESTRGNTVHIGSLDIHITPPPPPPVARVTRRAAPAPATGIARGFISAIGFRQG